MMGRAKADWMHPENVRGICDTLSEYFPDRLEELAKLYGVADPVTRTYYDVFLETLSPEEKAEFSRHSTEFSKCLINPEPLLPQGVEQTVSEEAQL